MMRSGNPALRDSVFQGVRTQDRSQAMTIQGTANKTLFLLLITFLSACWTWANPVKFVPFMWPLIIGGFVAALVTIFKKEWAFATAPVYALLEGLMLGVISVVFEKAYPGIVIHAVVLTFGTLFCLLLAYKSRLIRATENFKLGVVAATGGIMLVYIVDMIMGFFGHNIPFINQTGVLGIGFSVVVVIIAALNLVLDFDFIERGSEAGAPKYLEWYGAFALMVTLIWLYLEILRLLSKMSKK